MMLKVTVSLLTAILMLAVGLFWMFTWLIGTNGYSEAKGTIILVSNLALVLLSLVGSTLASGWLAGRLLAATAWSPWIVVPLAIIAVVIAALVLLIVGSLVVVLIV